MTQVAALYVESDGAYSGLPHVDPWDIGRDARQYAGPHPVVAHPPCQRWGRFWHGSTRKPHLRARVMGEIERLRREQAKAVMPLIGPLLDAWEGLPEDLRNEIEDVAPTLAANLESIDSAMEGDRNGVD